MLEDFTEKNLRRPSKLEGASIVNAKASMLNVKGFIIIQFR
jgi:hypothetical protein